KSLQEAAESVGLNEQELRDQLTRAEQQAHGAITHDFDSWDLAFLSDYIHNVHHKYVREQGPIIEQLADKVASRHGSEHSELLALAEGMHIFMADLYHHVKTEDEKLFPIIKQLVSGERLHTPDVKNTISAMEEEHENAGEELRQFR